MYHTLGGGDFCSEEVGGFVGRIRGRLQYITKKMSGGELAILSALSVDLGQVKQFSKLSTQRNHIPEKFDQFSFSFEVLLWQFY